MGYGPLPANWLTGDCHRSLPGMKGPSITVIPQITGYDEQEVLTKHTVRTFRAMPPIRCIHLR
jgi:hypothetical protein